MSFLCLPNSARLRRITGFTLVFLLAGCAVGPDFSKSDPPAPDSWTSWRSGDESLRIPLEEGDIIPGQWWQAFGDPVLNQLQARAFEYSPDLQTAALRFAQARVQSLGTQSQYGSDVAAHAGAVRQRQSEYGAGTRLIDAIGGDRETLVGVLSQPFTLYQAGFDVSWEPDLWGRVSRAIEASEANVAHQAALLQLSQLTLASDIARNYFLLRTTQRLTTLAKEDIAALQGRLEILKTQTESGVADHLDLERQRVDLLGRRAQLPILAANEASYINQIAILIGENPGALRGDLLSDKHISAPALPALTLGLPSEVALRRPDIRAAEAKLHQATANIGVARSALYPRIRLGARSGYESYLSGEFSDWGSRTWSIGPSLDLPIFDRGQRKTVIQLRELEQQEAAVAYQQTVLKAWHEIDNALTEYAAENERIQHLEKRMASAQSAYTLAEARFTSGAVDYLAVLDSQRVYLQTRRELVESQGQLGIYFVAVNKAIGNFTENLR